MRLAICLLLLVTIAVPVFATPTITFVDPLEGFTFAPTQVNIQGTGFNEGAVEVLFGKVPATILEASATHLRVLATPEGLDVGAAHEGAVDLKVRVAGHGEAVLLNAFYYSPRAQAGRDDYMQVLVPLTSLEIAGANGSRWTSELRVFNASSELLRMPGPETFIVELPIDPAVIVEPRTTEQVFLNRGLPGADGAFLYVPIALLGAPKFSLRVRDLSKNAASLGTDVPVIYAHEAKGDLTIVDVPVDPKYRGTLRIYGFTDAPMQVGVTVYPEDGDDVIQHFDLALNGIIHIENDPMPPYPAYVAIDPLTAIVRASGHERVRIEITNFNAILSPPPPPIWAFVSITNNETQQVTVVTPK
jgi:hypothetical protein